MGLNLPGALKNISSATYYLHNVGWHSWKNARKMMDQDPDIQSAMKAVEKEQGFLFPDITRDLVSEGWLPAEGIEKSNIHFDPYTKTLTIDGKDIRRTAGFADMGVDALLLFHKKSENWVRNDMFRTAFALKYKELMDSPEFVKEISGEFSEGTARNFAKNFALNQINQYAYEYSIHAKSRYMRGQSFYVDSAGDKQIWGKYKIIGGLKGAAQQAAFGLIHYPISLLGTHQFKAKGAWREQSVRSMEDRMGAGTMEQSMGRNSMWWGRYAMMTGTLGLMSVLFNVNLFNIVDLDTANRLRQAHNMLYTHNFSDDPEETAQS